MRSNRIDAVTVRGALALCGLSLLLAAQQSTGAEQATQVYQEATAIALGNMAWESVKVSEVTRDGALVRWQATTVTGKWRCQALPDGKKPYCER